MLRRSLIMYLVTLAAAGAILPAAATQSPAQAPELKIWHEFVVLLKEGRFTAERIRPMSELGEKMADALMGFLNTMRREAHWEEWDREPEVLKDSGRINFILPLTFGQSGERVSYCFTFVEDAGRWYFQHLEAIFIRLDKTPPPPTARFPDTSEAQKAWDREEDYWSKIIRWRGLLKDKGKEFFLDLLRDGNGYFVWAKSRAPFLPPHKAFILFLCWEQANLRGPNPQADAVTLETLTDREAVVRLAPIYFQLYQAATHLKPQISPADYREIFETIWQDRAGAAGWTLKIEYSDRQGTTQCIFRFRR